MALAKVCIIAHASGMESRLLTATLMLLADTKIPVEKIAADVGVSRRWLYELRRGDMKDPGVNKIEAVHDYLTGAGKDVAA